MAVDYHVCGRAACLSGCLFITGNVLHHAVEMMLKGELSRTVPLADLKNPKKFGHSLQKCWQAFKAVFPHEDLTRFDSLIDALDPFEDIRYPDKIVDNGVQVSFSFGQAEPHYGSTVRVPEYTLKIGEVDAFFACAIRLCQLKPAVCFDHLTEQGFTLLKTYNEEAKDWKYRQR
jgi:hypothetical protein